ncbi:MAG: ABC transporter ATP-binding protein [Polyangiaceae bacterium]
MAVAAKPVLRRLWPYVRQERGAFVVVFLSTWASSLFDLALPYVTGIMLLDHVVRQRRLEALPMVVAALVGIFVGQKVADFATDYVQTRLSQSLVHRLRCELFDHVQRLPVSFFDRHQSGEVLARVTGDIDTLDTLLTNVLPSLGGQLVTLTGAVVLLYVSCQSLTFFVLPTVVALAVSVGAFKGPVRGFARRARDAMGQMSGRASEAIAGVRMVKAFSAEAIEVKRFEGDSREVFRARLRSVVPQALFTATIDACVLVGTLLVVYFGTRRILAGTLTVGALVSSMGYLTRIYNEAKKASRMNIPIQRVVVAGERIFEVMDLPLEQEARTAERSGARRGPPARVQFENVTFGYEPDRPVIRNMNLDVAPGEVVALVGESGGGKTTLVNLLLRFYEPTAGRLRLDGVPLSEISLTELRDQIGLVSQDTLLFSGTVRDNIAYGNPDAGPEQIEAASRAAFAHDFVVKMPAGYDSVVGERGVMLSGGQRQRIAIARALVRDPRILVFDEATSNLDADSERYVQEAMRALVRERTVFVIAHRLSTIAWADRIVVIEGGKIAEIGTHQSLLDSKGIYNRLSTIQLGAKETGT